MNKFFTLLLMCLAATSISIAQTFENGPLSTGTLTKSEVLSPDGYTWSEVQNNAGEKKSNSNGGYACYKNSANNYGIADDFIVPDGETWNVTSASIFCYQTGYTGSTSPYSELHLRIWDGAPGAGGSHVVAGDLTTNAFQSSEDALMFRLFNTKYPAPGTPPNFDRLIWKTTGTITTQLTAGTYWLEWQIVLPSTSVSFAPSVTIVDQRTRPGANALQKNGNSYSAIIDAGNPTNASDEPQDMPFIINYEKLLPVSFVNFSGSVQKNNAILKWVTATEINNKGFEVQRSADGRNFSTIAFEKSAGNSTQMVSYTYTDANFSNIASSTGYYRLKQIDNDGRNVSYSGVLPLRKQINDVSWNIYPNPVADNAWLQLQLVESASVSVQIISRDGKVLRNIDKGIMQPGSQTIPLNMNTLAKGSYFITLKIGETTYNKTVIK